MNAQFFGYMILGILISGAGMSLCSLIVTIVLTSIKRPRLYHLLRFGMTTVGFSLSTFMLFCWVWYSVLFENSLDPAEILTLWTGVACYVIPMVMGALAAIGPKSPVVLWFGRFVMYLLTPLAAVWVARIPAFSKHGAEPLMWLFLYFVVTAIWWECLVRWDRRLQKERQQAWDPSFHHNHSLVHEP